MEWSGGDDLRRKADRHDMVADRLDDKLRSHITYFPTIPTSRRFTEPHGGRPYTIYDIRYTVPQRQHIRCHIYQDSKTVLKDGPDYGKANDSRKIPRYLQTGMDKSILFFTSPIGLGHASRDAAIGMHMANVRFLTGGPAARMLSEYGFEVDDPYTPPAFDVRNGRLQRTAVWLAKYYLYYKRCRKIAGRAIRRHGPDLVVSDEDFAAISAAQSMGIPAVLVTDILESHFTAGLMGMIERKMNRSMQTMMDRCHAVIIPETGTDEGNIRRVGPVVREITRDRALLRQDFGMCKKTILVTVGGTDAGAFLLEAMKPVSEQMSEETDIITVSGPTLGGELVRDLHQMIYAADLVVSLAGRSTIDEAASYGTPGIFIPISGHFEQEDNAHRVGYDKTDINRLYELVRSKLHSPRGKVSTGGAQRAAAVIQSILSDV